MVLSCLLTKYPLSSFSDLIPSLNHMILTHLLLTQLFSPADSSIGLGDYLIYSGGREQNRFAQLHGHENNSSTHSAIALTSITRDQEMSGDYIRSSTRGERDDDDEDNNGMENGRRVLNPFYVPGISIGGRHSLIHNDSENILAAAEEDSSINSRSQLDDKDTGQSSNP